MSSSVEMSERDFKGLQKKGSVEEGGFEHVGCEVGFDCGDTNKEMRSWSLWRGVIAEAFGMILFLASRSSLFVWSVCRYLLSCAWLVLKFVAHPSRVPFVAGMFCLRNSL